MLGITPSIGPLSGPLAGSSASYLEKTPWSPSTSILSAARNVRSIISNAVCIYVVIQVRYTDGVGTRRRSTLAIAALVAILPCRSAMKEKNVKKGCRMEPYRAGGCGVATFTHLCNLPGDTAISRRASIQGGGMQLQGRGSSLRAHALCPTLAMFASRSSGLLGHLPLTRPPSCLSFFPCAFLNLQGPFLRPYRFPLPPLPAFIALGTVGEFAVPSIRLNPWPGPYAFFFFFSSEEIIGLDMVMGPCSKANHGTHRRSPY
ncbi:hypothetical protein GGI43DRAFT_263588 [Trichoderma evansii]